MEQVFFNMPLAKLEPIFKKWMKEVQVEFQTKQFESPTSTEELLTIQEAAQFLKLTVPTIYSKVSKGELPSMKRSKRLYFSKNDLIEYIKRGRRKSNDEIENEALTYLEKKGGSHV